MISNIASTYVNGESMPHELIPLDDVYATYVINTEYLKDIYKIQLNDICLNPFMVSDDDIYSTYTDYLFILIIEISLFILANYKHDIKHISDVVLSEPYDDEIHIGDLIIPPDNTNVESMIRKLVDPICDVLEKHLLMLPKKVKKSYLIPLNWSYPDYKHLAIGEFYD